MKKIFILEDDPIRINAFRRYLPKIFPKEEVKIIWSDNVEVAKLEFKEFYPFDSILLDHDLDNQVFVDSEETNTGYQFIKWMKETYPDVVNTQIIIHSMNTVGANNMNRELNEAIQIPFPSLINTIRGQAQ